ncbi:MAG: LamG domain-containing protein [Flavobacteriales bacterium]|nr:LamG domain-containing protein [Flavobacteriales bacterium]
MMSFDVSQAQPWTNGVILHYPMNGNCQDISGNGLDGNVSATLSTDRFGSPNSCYAFNGTNEFIDLPNDPLLRPNFPFTVAYWVYLDAYSGGHVASDFINYIYSGFWIACNTDGTVNQNYAQGGAIGSSNRRTLRSNASLNLGQWYHLTAVYKGLNDLKLYIDCQLAASTYTGSGTALSYSGVAGSLGRKDTQGGSPDYLDGKLDELIIWDREVTPEEVAQLCSYSTALAPVAGQDVDPAPRISSATSTNGSFQLNVIGSGRLGVVVYDAAGKRISASILGQLTGQRTVVVPMPHADGLYLISLTRDGIPCDRVKVVVADQ